MCSFIFHIIFDKHILHLYIHHFCTFYYVLRIQLLCTRHCIFSYFWDRRSKCQCWSRIWKKYHVYTQLYQDQCWRDNCIYMFEYILKKKKKISDCWKWWSGVFAYKHSINIYIISTFIRCRALGFPFLINSFVFIYSLWKFISQNLF